MPKQRGKSDCAIAAIATLTGHSYRSVKTTCGWIERGGLEQHAIQWLLGKFCEWKRYRVRKRQSADEWAIAHADVRALLIVDTNDFLGETTHAVAAINGRIFNPSDGGGSSRQVLAAYRII